mgnify:CR=1 FL=1
MEKREKDFIQKLERTEQGIINMPKPTMLTDGHIIVDPFGSWTGVSLDDIYDPPVQDVDDL